MTKKAQAEGLTYRKTGAKLHKSIVHKILTNPIYYGDFDWAGRRYKGNHESIVSRELFDRVQEVLAERAGGEPASRNTTGRSRALFLVAIAAVH